MALLAFRALVYVQVGARPLARLGVFCLLTVALLAACAGDQQVSPTKLQPTDTQVPAPRAHPLTNS